MGRVSRISRRLPGKCTHFSRTDRLTCLLDRLGRMVSGRTYKCHPFFGSVCNMFRIASWCSPCCCCCPSFLKSLKLEWVCVRSQDFPVPPIRHFSLSAVWRVPWMAHSRFVNGTRIPTTRANPAVENAASIANQFFSRSNVSGSPRCMSIRCMFERACTHKVQVYGGRTFPWKCWICVAFYGSRSSEFISRSMDNAHRIKIESLFFLCQYWYSMHTNIEPMQKFWVLLAMVSCDYNQQLCAIETVRPFRSIQRAQVHVDIFIHFFACKLYNISISYIWRLNICHCRDSELQNSHNFFLY